MKLAKPSARDIDAAAELMQLLDTIDTGWRGPSPIHGAADYLPAFLGDDDFDSDNRRHLQVLHNHLARLLRNAPNFYGRVIGGMCYVICWDRNSILPPAQDVLDLHPDLRAGLMLLAQQRAEFMPRLEREARAAVALAVDMAAARHLNEMLAQQIVSWRARLWDTHLHEVSA